MSQGDIQKRESKELAPTESFGTMIPPGYEPMADEAIEEAGSHLWDYLGLVWRRRWLVLLVFLISGVIATFVALEARPFYEAVAKIEIKQPEGMKILSSKFEPIEDRGAQTSDHIETQIHILRSRDLARRVVERLDLFEPGEEEEAPTAEERKSWVAGFLAYFEKVEGYLGTFGARKRKTSDEPKDPAEEVMRASVNAFLQSYQVRQLRGTQIVEVKFVSEDPDLASRAANALCEEYISWTYEAKSNSYRKAIESLREELEAVKQKLGESEKNLQEFAKEHDMSVSADDSAEFSKRLGETQRQLDDAERLVFEKKQRLQRFDSPTSMAALLSDNPRVQKILDAIADNKAQLAKTKEQYGPEMQEIRASESALRELESQLKAEFRRAEEQARLEQREAMAAQDFLKKKYEEQSKALAKMEAIDSYNTLKEEVDLNRTIHNSLRQRERELIVTSRVQVGNVTIIEEAEPAASFPNKLRTLALGAFIGLFLAVALVFFLDYMDTRVKGPEEVERLAHLPTFGYIPHYKNGWRWRRPRARVALVAHEQPKSAVADSFRSLRTALQYSLAGRTPRTILVVSAMEGEGKTTVAANLAVSYAQKGKKVLLIDADLKRPTLHKLFEVARSRGLTDVLTGAFDDPLGCSGNDAFRTTGVSNLFLLPSGARVANAIDLLDSDVMRDLLVALFEEYDQIIIDSAPLTFRADATVLAPCVDGVVLVVQPGKTPRNSLRWVKERITAMQGRILGVVLNNPKSKPVRSNGYGYSYAYAYEHAARNEDGEAQEDGGRLAQAVRSGALLPPSEHDGRV